MDFFTTHSNPVSVNIDSTAYQVPRFLLPSLKAWAGELIKQQRDIALAQLATPNDRAQFLQYWPEPTFDIGDLYRRVSSPDGAEYVVNSQLKTAGVPDDVREKVIAYGDPAMIRALAVELTYAGPVMQKLGIDKDGADPLPPSAGASSDSQGTGPANTPASTPATAA